MLSGVLAAPAGGEDWPMYQHDAAGSGVSAERLAAPLRQAWVHLPAHPPRPAWGDPPPHDYWHRKHDLNPRVTYDRAFHVAAAGDAVAFASSGDDTVYCLSAADGTVRWTFCADGPLRLAPAFAGGRLYVGGDDGCVYCLAAADGKLLWKRRIGGDERKIIGNGRIISQWPIRTGVVVDAGVAYCCAGLFPEHAGVYLCALDAADGRELWKQRVNLSAQGYLLASPTRLIVPTGQTAPSVFDRRDGKSLGPISSPGGSFALVAGDVLAAGPGDAAQIDLSEGQTRERVVSFEGLRMIAHGPRYYLQSSTQVSALDRSRYMPLARRRGEAAKRRAALAEQVKRSAAGAGRAQLQEQLAQVDKQIAQCTAEMAACWLWRQPCRHRYSLILAGDLLLAGGDAEVAAYRCSDGRQVWSAPVEGRAYGLAAANGRLLVSTGQGNIHCFVPAPRAGGEGAVASAARPASRPATRPAERRDESLLAGWAFRADRVDGQTVRDLLGKAHAAATAPPVLDREGEFEFLRLDGSGELTIGGDMTSPALPRESFTAEAWVRLDHTREWGGIVGAIQDNGNYEKGWLLGFRNDRFTLALAAAKAPKADTRLTYLAASRPLRTGRWHHVAGTYDGKVTTLYVDGKAEASSSVQAGPIAYPPKAPYVMGSYHDDNEFYPLAGALHEVRVYGRALSPAEVLARYRRTATLAPATVLLAHPAVDTARAGRAVITFQSPLEGPAVVEYGPAPDALTARVEAVAFPPASEFTATLADLAPRTRYWYRARIVEASAGAERASEVFTFVSAVQPSPAVSPYARDEQSAWFEQAARAAAAQARGDQGFCLVLDSGQGRLAYEIALRTRMTVLAVDERANQVAAARALLGQAGLYGVRVTVLEGRLADLKLPPYFANLIVRGEPAGAGPPAAPPGEVYRLLRPCGGVLCLAGPPASLDTWLAGGTWHDERPPPAQAAGERAVVRRGPLPGAGQWTHGLADAGNTACSGDRRAVGPLDLQWFGEPGPRQMIDRHHRNPAPLYHDGRLFVPGDGVYFAVDAYNGAALWQVHVPHSRRLGVFLDSSNVLVDGERFFVAARDRCHVFDVATGAEQPSIFMPQPLAADGRMWGYLACADGVLVASARKPDAAYTQVSREADNELWYDNMSLVTSDSLFALARSDAARKWTYASGLILNTTIAIGQGRVYFVESHAPGALANRQGRMPMRTFLPGPNFLVALDLQSGKTLWKHPLDLSNCRHIAYLSYADGHLVLSGNRYVNGKLWYFVHGIEAGSGKTLWQRSHDSGYKTGGDHGEQNRHPTVVGDTVYAYPLAYRLKTGQPVEGWMFSRRGHGCGNVSASAQSLFWRGSNPQMWDLRPGKGPSRINAVSRPGCWINIIAAGGMVLIPEASSGCTCAYPLQTSLGYVPRGQE